MAELKFLKPMRQENGFTIYPFVECSCGEKFDLKEEDNLPNRCMCPNCGQWYDLEGNAVESPYVSDHMFFDEDDYYNYGDGSFDESLKESETPKEDLTLPNPNLEYYNLLEPTFLDIILNLELEKEGQEYMIEDWTYEVPREDLINLLLEYIGKDNWNEVTQADIDTVHNNYNDWIESLEEWCHDDAYDDAIDNHDPFDYGYTDDPTGELAAADDWYDAWKESQALGEAVGGKLMTDEELSFNVLYTYLIPMANKIIDKYNFGYFTRLRDDETSDIVDKIKVDKDGKSGETRGQALWVRQHLLNKGDVETGPITSSEVKDLQDKMKNENDDGIDAILQIILRGIDILKLKIRMNRAGERADNNNKIRSVGELFKEDENREWLEKHVKAIHVESPEDKYSVTVDLFDRMGSTNTDAIKMRPEGSKLNHSAEIVFEDYDPKTVPQGILDAFEIVDAHATDADGEEHNRAKDAAENGRISSVEFALALIKEGICDIS